MREFNRWSVVRRVANALRSECLAHEEEDLLGTEEELSLRFGISRPAFRQAAALLAHEQLLEIKRGVGGGYFVSRPKADAVEHMIAIYLQSRQADVDEIFLAIMPLRVELSRLAARCEDEERRTELARFLDAERSVAYPHLVKGNFEITEFKKFLKSERDFCQILGGMAENKVLRLFLEMLNQFFATMSKENDIYLRKLSRALIYRDLRMRIVEAILEKDEPLAMLHAARCGTALCDWLAEDRAASPRRGPGKVRLIQPIAPAVEPRRRKPARRSNAR